ncbi:hypothetical protein PoB_001080900 [Plakobranchus ocellatus]|uniref:Uncharacterized protein n=1 Tax=Plakobranchus ocellatus TaxID=259542 RepID=A0AAV3YQB6_9GAST|nr:hypothetical protein PoB_001080900 [Plakobranchus ocellatus]
MRLLSRDHDWFVARRLYNDATHKVFNNFTSRIFADILELAGKYRRWMQCANDPYIPVCVTSPGAEFPMSLSPLKRIPKKLDTVEDQRERRSKASWYKVRLTKRKITVRGRDEED